MAAKKKNKKSAELLKENLLADFPFDVSDSQVDIQVPLEDEETLIAPKAPPLSQNNASSVDNEETAIKTWEDAVEKFGELSVVSRIESSDENSDESIFGHVHEKGISVGVPGFDTGLEVENSSQLDLNKFELSIVKNLLPSEAKYPESKKDTQKEILDSQPIASAAVESNHEEIEDDQKQAVSPLASRSEDQWQDENLPQTFNEVLADESQFEKADSQNNQGSNELHSSHSFLVPDSAQNLQLNPPQNGQPDAFSKAISQPTSSPSEATEVLGQPKTQILSLDPVESIETRPVSYTNTLSHSSQVVDAEKTVAVKAKSSEPQETSPTHLNQSISRSVPSLTSKGAQSKANVFTSGDASLVQAEALRMAQNRILELEKEVDSLRFENMELANATETVGRKNEEQKNLLERIEQQNYESKMSLENEVNLLRSVIDSKDRDVIKLRNQVVELENKLRSDFRKIRVRERELENRLDLLKAEKTALVKSKDEYILDQKRKVDQLSNELASYKDKVDHLRKLISENQDQFKRTEKALRLALSNLEVSTDSDKVLKKAQ